MKIICRIFLFLLFSYSTLSGQTVSSLIDNYSGNVNWNESEGIITFETSGSINLSFKENFKNFIWDVPAEVKTIVIKENVTVNGAFHTYHNCTIKGEDRKTSFLFGTNEREWSKNKRDQGFEDVRAFKYSTIEAHSGTTYIQNLTSLNPWGFHARGGMLHLSYCDFIDNRGGHGNNSDGFVGSNGSTVDNCFFSTADDIIKLYNDVTVTNTTIEMIPNAVPIQLGWGNTGNSTGTFKNVIITGNAGRGNDGRAVIVGRAGVYSKTINIDGCDIQNPNATWLSLRESGQIVKGEVTNAKINISKFWGPYTLGNNQMTICGSQNETNNYDCAITTKAFNALGSDNIKIFPNPANDKIIISGLSVGCKLKINDVAGRYVYKKQIDCSEYIVDVSSCEKGIYFVRIISKGKSYSNKILVN